MCPKRKSHLTKLFAHPMITPYFEPPTFTLGIPLSFLRNSYKLIQHAGKADILTSDKLKVLSLPDIRDVYKHNPTQFFSHLETVLQNG